MNHKTLEFSMPSDHGHFAALLQALLIIMVAAALGLGLAATGDSPPLLAPVQSSDAPQIRTLTLEQASKLHDAGTAVFLDVRDILDYMDSHLPGAGNLPYAPDRQTDSPVTIVIYCSDSSCGKASSMAKLMQENGLEVAVLPDGAQGWAGSGGILEMAQ